MTKGHCSFLSILGINKDHHATFAQLYSCLVAQVFKNIEREFSEMHLNSVVQACNLHLSLFHFGLDFYGSDGRADCRVNTKVVY